MTSTESKGWWNSFFKGPYAQIQLHESEQVERTSDQVNFVVSVLELGGGEHILDAPCGVGRHSIELAARGFAPTGVDFNERAIETARERAKALNVGVEFRVQDMREINDTATFDAAMCFLGSFGYFSDEDNLRHVTAIAKALKPGGRFLVETHTVETLARIFTPRTWEWLQDSQSGDRVLEEREWDLENGRMEGTWTFVSDDGAETVRSSVRIYAYSELCRLLREAGFSSFKGYDTATKTPFQVGSRRLALVATR